MAAHEDPVTSAQRPFLTEALRPQQERLSFLPAGSLTGELIRQVDWSNTAVGPVEGWPQSLLTSISICLNSRFPMLIWWGPSFIKIYNDAYITMLGEKHPRALGQPGKEVWPEIWPIIGPMLEGVMQRGEATWSEDTMLPLERKGFIEECYFTFSYSPINIESGEIGGVFTAVSETSAKVIGERRLDTLRKLGTLGPTAKSAPQAAQLAASILSKNLSDLPFSLVYLLAPDDCLVLHGLAGFDHTQASAPPQIRLKEPESSMSRLFRDALQSERLLEIEDTGVLTRLRPHSHSLEQPKRAAALRITGPAEDRMGLLIVGISPRLSLDDNYRTFLGLVAGQVGSSISAANAYEAERKRAESLAELDRAKTTFFSNISHEFRTPIALMIGPLEECLAHPNLEPSKLQERVEIAHRNALRLQKLVNTLLEFSRIEAGRVTATYCPTDLARLTEELASVFRSTIEKAGLKYSVSTSELREAAYVDREMWEKIVLNLLSNAFKFTFEGEIEVSLTGSDDMAVLRVRDTGTGIPAAELPRLFERFYQVTGTVGRTQEGSGIGLALIQELVRLHAGTIVVNSEAGKGTVFEVRVPLGKAHLPAESLLVDADSSSTGSYVRASAAEAERWIFNAEPSRDPTPTAQRRPRIVLADDNADMRAYIKSLLVDTCEVLAVSDGEAAFAAASARPPDLVLSDVMMPKLDGFGLIARLRKHAPTQDVPVLLLSARAGEEARIEGLRAGANDYLVKPFSAKELVARVHTHLQIGRLKAAAELERSKLTAVFAQAPIGIALLEGPEHLFSIANPVYCDLLFGAPRAFIGQKVRDAIPESIAQGFVALLDRVYRTGEAFVGTEMPIDLVQQDGHHRRFYLDFVYQPLRDANNQVQGIVAVIHDVTERVRNRLSLEEKEQRLEQSVADLELERELRERFVAMLTHDLRTPLQAVTMSAHVIRRKLSDNEVAQQFAGRIIENIRRADEMIRNLLDANRLKAGEPLVMEMAHCELNEIAEDTLADLATLHGDRFILNANSRIHGYWSRGEIRRVLENLCTNAIKYGDPYRPVRVTLAEGADGVRIEVQNEGNPIPAAGLEKLFRPFKRIDTGHSGGPDGWGLGLILVKGIAEAHGGGVTVRSEPGSGTVFVVTLPTDSRGDSSTHGVKESDPAN